jgi:hypothetical protein
MLGIVLTIESREALSKADKTAAIINQPLSGTTLDLLQRTIILEAVGANA